MAPGDTEIAHLGIAIDASQVTPAATKLNTLTDAGTKAEGATSKLTKATKALASAEADWAKITAPKAAALGTQAQQATAAAAATASVAKATDMAGEAAKKAAVATADLGKSHAALSTQAQALFHSMRGSTEMLLAGIPPTRILALEMNNLTFAASGPGGLKSAFNNLMSGGIGVAVRFAAMLAPILAVAGGIGFLSLAVFKQQEANDKLENSLQGIGRIAGATSAQVTQAATSAATAANVSISAATEWASTYATTAKVSGNVLIGLTALTKDYALATGQDTTEAVKSLGKAFADPTKGAEELQAQFGLLNGTQLQSIKQMQEQGNLLGAQEALYAQLNKTLDDTALVHVHGLASAWESVKNFASDAWHAMVIAAGGGTALDNLASAQERLKNSRRAAGSFIDPGEANNIRMYQQEVAAAQTEVDRLTASQKKNHDQALANSQSAAGVSLASTLIPEASAVDELNTKLGILTKAKASALKAGESPENVARLDKAYSLVSDTLGRVNEAYAKYGDQSGVNHAIAQLEAQDAATKDHAKKGELQTQIVLLKSLGDLATNEQLLAKARDAGLIVSNKLDNTDKSRLDSANKLLTQTQNQAKVIGDLNEAIRSGKITADEANDQLRLTNELKSIEAERDNASGSLKAKLTAIIIKLTPAYSDLNEKQRENALLNNLAGQADQLAFLSKQLELVGSSNKERAIELALLKAKQDLSNGKSGTFDAANPTADQQKYLDNAGKIASQTVDLTSRQDEYNTSLTFTRDMLAEISNGAQTAAAGLSDAFGAVGAAIEGMSGALFSHSEAQAAFAVEQEKLNKRAEDGQDISKEQILLTQKQSNADSRYYSDTLAAAKGFFDKKSAGYKILTAIEGVYNAIKLANAFAQIAAEGLVLSTKVATVGPTIAADAAKTASGVAAGAANIFAELGPWGFPVVAGMLAVMLGLGFGGGSGASSAPPVDIAKDRQASQGAGSVLGDPTGKSESIAKSLDQLARDTNTDLEYSNQMVTSLRAIQSGIGSLTGLLARQLGVNGLFDTSKLGLGTSSSSGIFGGIPILGSLFGGSSKTTTELLDQGISIASTTIANALASGISASAYQTVKSTTEKSGSFFGLFGGGTSTSTRTNNSALSGDFTSQISGIISGLRDTVLSAATKLGVVGAQEVVDSLSLNIGSVSFKDMTGAEIQDALNAVFSKVGDQIVQAAIPSVSALQKVGEGALETLARLVQEYSVVDDTLVLMGKTFNGVGLASLEARDRLVEISGGLDEFSSQGKFFVENFISSAKALVPVQAAVNRELDRLGASGIVNKDQFAQLVQGIDVSTSAGSALYAALMKVAPAFSKVTDAADTLASKRTDLEIKLLQAQGDAAGATAKQRQKELDALDSSLKPLQLLVTATQDWADKLASAKNDLTASANQMATFAKNLTNFRRSLDSSTLAANNPARQLAVTKQIFEETARAAKLGDTQALASLQQVSQDFLAALNNDAKTSAEYQDGLAAVKDATGTSADYAQGQVDLAQSQLGALLTINKSVLTVTDAINNLLLIQSQQPTAASVAASNPVIAAVTNSVVEEILAKVNAPDNKSQDDYNTVVGKLDRLASSALSLLRAAGVYAEWNVPTNAATGEIGSFSVGSNLYSDPRLASTLSVFSGMQQQYIDLFTQAQSLFASIPGHATGLSKVPYDGYLMRAHEGEAVLTKTEAGEWRGKKNGGGNSELVAEVRAMRAQLNKLDTISDATEKTARILKEVSPNGNALQTEAPT